MPIVELRGALPEAVLGFLDRAVSPRGRRHWEWKYVGRAAAPGPPGLYWVEKDGSVTGFIGLMGTALQTANTEHGAAWFVDWHVAPGTQGVGFALLRKAEAAAGILLTLQGSHDTRQILPRLGWRDSGAPQTCVRPLGGRFVSRWLGRRLPSWALPVAAAARLAGPLWRSRRPPAVAGFHLRGVDRFAEDYDAVWGQRRAEFGPAMRRDSGYLNHLCADYPEGGYRLSLLQAGEETSGHLIVRCDTDARGLRRGRIVDLLWPRTRAELAAWLVQQGCWQLQQEGADYVECVASVPDLLAALRDCGFRTRSSVPIWYHRLPADAPPPHDWYVTFLDCDRAYR